MRADDLPFLSVIIPVYRDHQGAKRVVEALSRQTYPSPRLEILLVNNAPDDPFPEGSWLQASCIRVTEEAKPGSYQARNKGIAMAKGDLLVFTDADCTPVPDWLENGVRFMQAHPDCSIAGGDVGIFYQDPLHPCPPEYYDAEISLRQEHFIRNAGFALTANLFTYPSLFKTIGGFDGSLKSGGDREWCLRAQKAGYQLLFSPEAKVFHPSRNSWKSVIGRSIRVAGDSSTGRVSLKNAESRGLLVLFFHQLIRRPFQLIRELRQKKTSPTLKDCLEILFFYYVIKMFQIGERIKVLLGGEPLR